jgi:C4-dicarboxylate-specific signal transduction histidine kinase
MFASRRTELAGRAPSPRDTVNELQVQLSELAKTMKDAAETLPGLAHEQSKDVAEQLAGTTQTLKRAQKAFAELTSQAGVSRTLATIGIASATFGHETQSGLDSMRGILKGMRTLLEAAEPQAVIVSELCKAIRESEKVSAWGKFALGRVRRERRIRATAQIDVLIGGVLDELTPAMDVSSIAISRELRPVKSRIFAMDVECVVINLLANAYYFSKQSTNQRCVSVTLRPKKYEQRSGFEIVVADSGPGVAESIREQIWEPLFTTKTDADGKEVGTGLGLALVDAVVRDVEGQRTVQHDPDLGGARFAIWFPDSGV